MDNSMPVGNRLIETLRCEQCESSFAYTSEDIDKVCRLVDESIALIKRFRAKNGFSNDLKPPAMVVGLFKNFDRVDEKQRLRLTAQCSEEFLVWCRHEIKNGEHGVCRLLLILHTTLRILVILVRILTQASQGTLISGFREILLSKFSIGFAGEECQSGSQVSSCVYLNCDR